ncbi:SAM-dependent methyltransferase [Microbacterium endophyticum]|uniref:SAM-dependent methyltransferase n=1 Tax=Microbacterium endophyticum TaxID=1526412 RepID=A0A7W4YNC8_9MICO|nr:class I SAM-dependent methyltransferase [Microbacterium endophyticum]MBB2975551.1 SAM-dependent methyltransferase [Microbacterium endophyticum]NIK35430.1 SAM-dependent methyltransferase [Microbacterium endophyticum]
MSENTTVDRALVAREVIARWDAQQTGYIRRRAERFDTIGRTVAHVCAGVAEPRVLDLAGGAGSLGAAVLEHVPTAHVVIADKDPALLALARDAWAGDARVEVAQIDLDSDVWVRHPAIVAGEFDAVVSSTALHWLSPDALVRVYFALSGLARPGGIVLNGDHLSYDAVSEPAMRAFALSDDADMQRDTFGAGVDTWDEWWDAVAASGAYGTELAARDAVWGSELHEPPLKVTLGFHLETLRSAGFAQVGTVWQYLDDHVLYGVR